MTETHILQAPDRLPRLYRDLAGWYPLLTPASEYAGEAAFCQGVFEIHCRRRPRTLLDLGSGGGHTASHLKAHLAVTLADLSPEMLAVSRRLNPGCEHIQGDMRSLRLGRLFDCVLIHDAVCYMTSREDLGQAVATALAHCAPGGVALFQPDYVLETFEEGTEVGGSDAEDRALRYIEWRWAPDPTDEIYLTDMAYLLRHRSGALEVVHDRHLMGLFARATWLELIAAAGFNSLALPFERGSPHAAGSEVFLGLRPGEPAGPFEMRQPGMTPPSSRSWEVFFDVCEALPRQGPGDRNSTARAFSRRRDLPPAPAILDLGCGVGGQTLSARSLRLCRSLLRPGGQVALTDAAWRKAQALR